MKLFPMLILALGPGMTMCGTREHPQPSTQVKPIGAGTAAKPPLKEKPMAEARWLEVAAAGHTFLIVKIADRESRPEGEFEGEDSPAGKTLFYILVPHSAAAADIAHEVAGRKSVLMKPRMIHRMPGSALYTHFSADPARAGTLSFTLGAKAETVSLDGRKAALQGLPFFWSGGGAGRAIAFEEVPGWMEQSGP